MTSVTLPTTEQPGLSSPQSEFVRARDLEKSDQSPRRWHDYLRSEITLNHADIPTILCCLVSGLCDASAYNAWGCFIGMQTGNTIFLALGAAHLPPSDPYGWLKCLVSIAFFLLGCLTFTQTRLVGPRKRITLSTSFLLQALLIFVAAILVATSVVPAPLDSAAETTVQFIELIPIALLAFQSGGQIVTSRLLGFNEVPTIVLTSVYCDLAMDKEILKVRGNVKRNRRVAAVIGILVGGIAGGWLSRSNGGLQSALWLAGGIKVGIAASWGLWRTN